MESNRKSVVVALIFITCVKILCIPAYRSTDFDVHRNWLAITRHLPLQEWYFDDVNGTTVHTLDYPPTFAYIEFIFSNNPLTKWLVSSRVIDERCLDLLPDSDNIPSSECVVFHRATVILSDVILWIGAFVACDTTQGFLLIVLNPGLLWLDHIHFQYNGAMLGILLTSLGLLVHAQKKEGSTYHVYHLVAAILYAILLTMKHLYLPLAPLYFCYLLSTYCFQGSKFSWRNFGMLACVTGTTLIVPFIPFLLLGDSTNQISQIATRLFPFGRGLVHDYWAGNVWALWMLADKIVRKVFGSSMPSISPTICAICLFVGLVPGLVSGWKASARTFLYAVVFCAMSSFMLAWHVHEKAIMTAIIPLAMLLQNQGDKLIFLRMNALGLVGLFPLLFRPIELPLKLVTSGAYMSFAYCHLGEPKLTSYDLIGSVMLLVTVFFLEIAHPLVVFPRMQFLPLLITSTVCALGLAACWFKTLQFMRGSIEQTKTGV